MSVLQRILGDVRRAVDAARAAQPEIQAQAQAWVASNSRRDLCAALGAQDEVSVIAEFKRASPSRGPISPEAQPDATSQIYAHAGARAMSVLTEPQHFGGSLDHLVTARAASDLPVLRKDFILDPYQVHQAAAAGADGLLLMASVLDDALLASLHQLAGSYGICCLVEVHDSAEIDRIRPLKPRLVGINNRDLKTLQVDLSRSIGLRAEVDWPALVVAESGVDAPEQMAGIVAAGFDAVLIGSALMTAADPSALLARIVAAGRRSG